MAAAVVTIALVGAMNASLASVEHALTEGPSKQVSTALLSEPGLTGAGSLSVIVSHPKVSFMDSSFIAEQQLTSLIESCPDSETLIPFGLDLPIIDAGDHVHNAMRITTRATDSGSIAAAPSIGGVGDQISIDGAPATISRQADEQLDFINRTTLVQQSPGFTGPVWGVLVPDATSQLQACAQQSGLALVSFGARYCQPTAQEFCVVAEG